MGTLWGREPAMFLAVIQAALALAIGFGIKVTIEQFALIMAFVAALVGFITRSQVVPAEKLSAQTLKKIEDK